MNALQSLIVALNATALPAAEAESPQAEAGSTLTGTILGDLAIYAVGTLILLALIALLLKLLQGVGSLEEEGRLAEEMFAAEIIQEVEGKAPAQRQASLAPPGDATAGEAKRHGEATQPPPRSVSVGNVVDDFAQRLVSLGVVGGMEGIVSLPIPPDGRIYALKRGGSCLILPRQESPELMHHFCRRFDMVIVPGENGDGLVYERFQARLNGLLELGGQSR